MFKLKKSRALILLLLLILIGSNNKVFANSGFISLLSVQVSTMSSDEIKAFVTTQQQKGLTNEQIKSLAKSNGVSDSEISSIEDKLGGTPKIESEVDTSLNVKPSTIATNPNASIQQEVKNDPLFGYDFFNNPNISFQPNLNLATPANYQLGPGDALVISLWGAAENTYDVEVNRNGLVKLPNIGPVVVSGLSIEDATQKIKSALKRIYAGISAPDSSPYKIFTSVSLSNVRSVQVDIIGQVKVPGTYSLSALSTVLNGLYASGGPTKNGTFREIKLVRNGKEISYFDIYKYLIDGSQEGNKTLQDQDVIIVGAYTSKISINGAVKRPGVYEIKNSETLDDLLGFVSGFKSNAYRNNIKLTRIEGDRKKLKEIDYTNFRSFRLFDGDVINVGSIIDKIENSVTINGSVYRPGDFEYTPNISLLQLLEKASGITESAYLERGIVKRQEKEGDVKTIISFSVTDILNGKETILLKPNDIVQIFNKSVVEDKGKISISGAVNNATSIQFIEGITLEDLVITAGGYSKNANSEVIDVIREVIDEDYKTLNKVFNISADKSLDLSNNTPFVFEPNDQIVVRSLMGSGDQLYTFIEGEVSYPGQYFSESKNEKLLDLLDKAGGLSPYAFQEGATLIRQNPYFNEKALSITTKSINVDDEDTKVNVDLNNQKEFRVGIDLKKLLKEGESSKQNLVLNNGDRLVIPSVKQTVKVEGEVLLPTLIRFDKGDNLKDYINKSGGFSSEAKKGKVYVIHPNGDIASTKHFLFFRTYPDIKPGSIVLVPKKQENVSKLSTQEVIGISTGFTTLALLIERLFN